MVLINVLCRLTSFSLTVIWTAVSALVLEIEYGGVSNSVHSNRDIVVIVSRGCI